MATTKKTTAEPAHKAAKAQPASRSVPTHLTVPVRSAAEVKAAAALEAAAAQGRAALQLQMKQWEEAVRMFSQKQFSAANDRFALAATGPAAHIADKARSYAQICSRKMNGTEVDLHTADDHFNYGVERLNARDMDVARKHLDRALAMEPDGEHILFTLALCCGLTGDGAGACENLKRAIALEPRNRILARQDPEFSALAQQLPALRALLTASEHTDSF
jgi:tetratricopeptide (TPR) repeat protein